MRKSPKPSSAHLPSHRTRLTVGELRACLLRLDDAQTRGGLQTVLQGRHLGLLCAGQTTDVAAFQQAAGELGARVAVLASDLAWANDPHQVTETARLLSRLYDAVTCAGVPNAVVDSLARAATIRVSSEYVRASARLDTWAARLDALAPVEHTRRSLLQALVVLSMG